MIKVLSRLHQILKIATISFLLPGMAQAVEFDVDRTKSVFAMVTHKEGIAAHLAHEHLIYPGTYTIRVTADEDIAVDSGAISSGHFDLRFSAKDLVVDDPVAKQRWIAGIQKLKILDKPFPEVPEDARKKIYKTMLSSEQLDAAAFPEISIRTTAIRPQPGETVSAEAAHSVEIEMTVHGHTVTTDCPASISWQGNTLRVEAKGSFKFTDFGIRPYSAMLGAIRNRDEFNLYVNFVAHRRGA